MAIELYRRPGRKNWYMRGTFRGVSVYESTGIASRKMAEDVVAAVQRRILDGDVTKGRATLTFKEAAATYLEKGGDKTHLGRVDPETGEATKLLGYFGDTPLCEIGDEEVCACIREIYPTAKPSTVNRQVYVPISAIFNTLDVKPKTKLKKWRESRPVTQYARRDLFAKTIEAYEGIPNLQLLCIAMATTGRRVGEMVAIMRKDVDWTTGIVDLGRTKNSEERSVCFPNWLLVQLSELPTYKNGHLFGYKMRYGVYAAMKRRCKKAGIRYMSPHKIGRHTFATNAMRGGMNLKQIMSAGGWRSLAAVERYLHVTPDEEQARASEIARESLDLCQIRATRKSDAD